MRKLLATAGLILASASAFAGYPWSPNTALTSADLNAAFAARATFASGPLTPYAMLVGNGAGDIEPLVSLGTTGWVMTSNGAGMPPSFQPNPLATLPSTTSLYKGTGTAGIATAAFPGTDYLAPGYVSTITAAMTFQGSIARILGSGSGYVALASANSGASNYTATYPANAGTLAELNYTQTWSAVQTYLNSDICLLGSSTGCTTFTSANSSATNYTLTFPATTDTLATLSNISTSLPSATTSQLYGGTGSASVARPISLATGLSIVGSTLTPVVQVIGTGLTNSSGTITSIQNGYINGFGLSNDGTTPTTVLDIAAGYAAGSANATMITGTAFTKTVSGTWVAGSGNAGMGASLTVAASTWYHVFAIINAGSYDVYFDTSPTAANAPASTTAYRRIGSFKTNGSSQIIAFYQNGQNFQWAAAVNDVSASGTAATAALYILSVPLGVVTFPQITTTNTASLNYVKVWSPQLGVTIPTQASFMATGSAAASTLPPIYATNTSSQLYAAAQTTSALGIWTLGWIDPHVAPNW